MNRSVKMSKDSLSKVEVARRTVIILDKLKKGFK